MFPISCFMGTPLVPKFMMLKRYHCQHHQNLICFSYVSQFFPMFYQYFLTFFPVSPSFPLGFPHFSIGSHNFSHIFAIFSPIFPQRPKDVTSFSCIVTSAAQASCWRLALSIFKETMNRVGAQGMGRAWAGQGEWFFCQPWIFENPVKTAVFYWWGTIKKSIRLYMTIGGVPP